MGNEMASASSKGNTTASALNPTAVFSALSNDIRWRAVQLMVDGTKIRATDLAAAVVGRDFDICSKHLVTLAQAGVADRVYGQDRRMLFYFIPEQFRPQPGVVNYGFCVLRFGKATPAGAIPLTGKD
jgi:hypothetical protein